MSFSGCLLMVLMSVDTKRRVRAAYVCFKHNIRTAEMLKETFLDPLQMRKAFGHDTAEELWDVLYPGPFDRLPPPMSNPMNVEETEVNFFADSVQHKNSDVKVSQDTVCIDYLVQGIVSKVSIEEPQEVKGLLWYGKDQLSGF